MTQILTLFFLSAVTAAPIHLWFLLLWSVGTRFRNKKKAQLVDSQWCNWFEVVKLVSALVGAAALNLFQLYGVYNETTHLVLAVLLSINILEAVVSDLMRSWFAVPNAMAGALLLALTPWSPLATLSAFAASNKLAVFPVDVRYIVVYTMWNGAFSYGGNWSWSTRLVLLAPIVTVIVYGNTSVWLCARCLSLMLNMIFRASETTRFYVPGKTIVTQTPCTFVHNEKFCFGWGCLNMAVALFALTGTSQEPHRNLIGTSQE